MPHRNHSCLKIHQKQHQIKKLNHKCWYTNPNNIKRCQVFNSFHSLFALKRKKQLNCQKLKISSFLASSMTVEPKATSKKQVIFC